jgi:predicted phosphoribosyltransferase
MFRDRRDAGQRLARALELYRDANANVKIGDGRP